MILCIVMSFSVASQANEFEFLERKLFDADFNSFYLGQKACISATFGYDWLESVLLKILK